MLSSNGNVSTSFKNVRSYSEVFSSPFWKKILPCHVKVLSVDMRCIFLRLQWKRCGVDDNSLRFWLPNVVWTCVIKKSWNLVKNQFGFSNLLDWFNVALEWFSHNLFPASRNWFGKRRGLMKIIPFSYKYSSAFHAARGFLVAVSSDCFKDGIVNNFVGGKIWACNVAKHHPWWFFPTREWWRSLIRD